MADDPPMNTNDSATTPTNGVRTNGDTPASNAVDQTEALSPILASDAEFDSSNEQHPPTRSPTPTPPPANLSRQSQQQQQQQQQHSSQQPSTFKQHFSQPSQPQHQQHQQQHQQPHQQPQPQYPHQHQPPSFGHSSSHVDYSRSHSVKHDFGYPHHGQMQDSSQGNPSTGRGLQVPAALRRNNSSFTPFSEIPSLPTFLNNCNLSQYLQSFNDAGANDDAIPMMLDFDDDDFKTIMDAVPMKPFHAIAFKRGIRDLRERSRMNSMHFDNQSSFMHPEPHATLQVSHSQFFQSTQTVPYSSQHQSQHLSQHQSQPSLSQHQSQPSQSSHHSQTSHSPHLSRGYSSMQQQPGLYRQTSQSNKSGARPSSQSYGSSMPHPPQLVPTPTQVLSGLYQTSSDGMTRSSQGQTAHQYMSPAHEHAPLQRSASKMDHRTGIKRRRSYSGSPPVETTDASSSPVLPEPSPVNSHNSSSHDHSQGTSQTAVDPLSREAIMHQALIYGKHSSRSLTKYEMAINRAAQSLALEDPSLLAHKGTLWNKAKAKLLGDEYDYKRGKSRSKLPEAAQHVPVKSTKETLMQKREANASNNSDARRQRMASLAEELQRKTAEREEILGRLLEVELPTYRAQHPTVFESQAREFREQLSKVEAERNAVSKELGALRNKERKHQWYERRKRLKGDGGTDAEADEEGGGGGTDTTMDPDGDYIQKPSSKASTATSTKTSPNELVWKQENPEVAPAEAKSKAPRPADGSSADATTTAAAAAATTATTTTTATTATTGSKRTGESSSTTTTRSKKDIFRHSVHAPSAPPTSLPIASSSATAASVPAPASTTSTTAMSTLI
ncbi:hypothetical protein BGZ94_002235 [Podila epigama]|nr:hypothetical protein BGZ94_002235 [Podila epigama]